MTVDSDSGPRPQHGVTKLRPLPARKLQALVPDRSVEEGAEKRRSAVCALQAKPNIVLRLRLRPILSQSSGQVTSPKTDNLYNVTFVT